MMRIAVFYDIITGGAKRSVYEFARSLKARGHRIELYAPTMDDHFLADDTFADRRYNFQYRPIFNLGERTLLFSPLMGLELIKLFAFSKGLARAIDQNKYDIVFVHNSRFTQCPVVLRYLKTPSIYYCHEPLRFVTEPHPIINGSKERMRSLVIFLTKLFQRLLFNLESSNLKRANLILTNSFFTMENLYRSYGTYSIPNYQGVDTDTFRPLGAERGNFVLTVGQLNRWKGQEFLVQCLSQVPVDRRPSLYLVYDKCAHRYKRYIDELAERLKVHVYHYQNISVDELVQLYNQARVFVYAPVMEPFGFTPLEAMACETPVVAVKEGGIRETVVHNQTGFLTSRDSEDFTRALDYLITNDQLRQKFGKSARRCVVRQWSWKQSAKRLEHHMYRLLERRASSPEFKIAGSNPKTVQRIVT
jgi:glycosyltransferase involved in cell wall biosynthesis